MITKEKLAIGMACVGSLQTDGLIDCQLTPIAEYFVDPGLSRQKCIVYVAEFSIEGGDQELDTTAFDLKYQKLPIATLSAMIHQGEIVDSWSLNGVYLLFGYTYFLGENQHSCGTRQSEHNGVFSCVIKSVIRHEWPI